MELGVEALRVLIVEDSEDDAALLERQLRRQWPESHVVRVETEAALRSALEHDRWDVVLSDYSLPSFSALGALEVVRATGLDVPFLVVSGSVSEESAVEVLRAGAVDFLSKGRWTRLAPAIQREVREAQTRHARRVAEQQLTQALERSAFAMHAAGIGTWELDVASGVRRWSPGLEAMHGITAGNFDGTLASFMQIVHPHDRAEVEAFLAAIVADEAEHRVSYRVVWPDKSVHWISRRGRGFFENGHTVVRAAGVGIDVTAQHELEDTLRQAQKMESVGNLAGGVAHDFNNLLTVITGYGEMLRERLAIDAEAVADLNEMLHAAKSATVMTRQLLAFSRRQVLSPKVVALNDTVRDLRTMLNRLIEANVQMDFQLTTDPTFVRVDPGQIEQVLINLVVNARDAMPTGGRLFIETSVAHDAGTPHVRLAVRDTGTGMSPEVQAKVFEPFFTTKEAGRGTGLGLATVYGIVQQSGGTIKLHSEMGKGTEFAIYLPATAAPEGHAAATERAAGEILALNLTALVVEDDRQLRLFTERAMRELGCTPIVAASAEEAQRLCESHEGPIDVALIDVMMPGRGGVAFGQWIREHRPQTKLIYTSGYSRQKLDGNGILAGAEFLEKPFTKASLAERLIRASRDPHKSRPRRRRDDPAE